MSDAKPRSGALELVGEFLDRFAALGQQLKLYGAEHPRTEGGWEAFVEARRRVLESRRDRGDRLAIAFHDGRFYLENIPLPRHPAQAHALQEHLERLEMGGFLISLGMPRGEVELVLAHLYRRRQDGPDPELPEGFRWVSREELHRLEAGSVEERVQVRVLFETAEILVDDRLYNEGLETLSVAFESVGRGDRLEVGPVRELATRLSSAIRERPEELVPLTTLPYYAEFVLYHALNTAILAGHSAARVGVEGAWLRSFVEAALLHDIGLATVASETLHRGSALSTDEAEELMAHPLRGAAILLGAPDVDPLAVCVAFGHHVKRGGHGYPPMAPDHETGPFTRLLCVADMFEALTSFRPHKRPDSPPDAFGRLYAEPGMAWGRAFIDLLAGAIGFHPAGTRVQTGGGGLAVVRSHREGDPYRPVVRLLEARPDGRLLSAGDLDAVCGDLPWRLHTAGEGTVIRTLDALTDLDLMTRSARVVEV